MITAKTSNPSNIYLEIAILYKIREENLFDIYKKWPTQNIQRDYILFAKVLHNFSLIFKGRYIKST